VLLTSCTRKTYSHTDSSVPDGTGGERTLHARGTIFRDEYIYGTEFGSSAAALTAAPGSLLLHELPVFGRTAESVGYVEQSLDSSPMLLELGARLTRNYEAGRFARADSSGSLEGNLYLGAVVEPVECREGISLLVVVVHNAHRAACIAQVRGATWDFLPVAPRKMPLFPARATTQIPAVRVHGARALCEVPLFLLPARASLVLDQPAYGASTLERRRHCS
jgi:hypothetical protein